MFCPNCGNELREDAYFCGSCGTQVGNAIQPTQQHPANQRPLTAEDLKNYHEAARAEREFEKNVEKTSEYAVLMEEEHKRLKSRFTICTILGAIIAIFFGTLMMGSMAQSTSTASFDSAPVVLIACAFYFFIPFGCLPVIDFCKNTGSLFGQPQFSLCFSSCSFSCLHSLLESQASSASARRLRGQKRKQTLPMSSSLLSLPRQRGNKCFALNAAWKTQPTQMFALPAERH